MRVKHDTSDSQHRNWATAVLAVGALLIACGGPGDDAPARAKASGIEAKAASEAGANYNDNTILKIFGSEKPIPFFNLTFWYVLYFGFNLNF